jgi:hypothetical protein
MERALNLKSWINYRTVLVVFILMIPFNALIFPARTRRLSALSGLPNPTLDARPGYTAQEAFSLAGALGPQGRQLYALSEVTADLVFPVLYNLLTGLLLALVVPKAFPNASLRLRETLPRLPILTAIADYLENAGIVTLLMVYPSQPTALAWVTSGFTLTKYILLAAGALPVLVSAGVLGYKYIRGLFARRSPGK